MELFLLGAGFNADAKSETGIALGNSCYHGTYSIDCGYPLIAETARLCFDLAEAPQDKSIEDLFAEALERHNFKPMDNLSEQLMEADYRLATRLCTAGRNCYKDFFEKFVDAHFLTFNYDSLPEIFLHRLNRWYPQDGYGVPVEAEPSFGFDDIIQQRSSSLVLHLHGSLCVLTTESELEPIPGKRTEWIIRHRQPKYGFDPDSISGCFPKYRRVMWATGQVRIPDRVVAPVPDKAEGLQSPFIHAAYDKACHQVSVSGSLIAVGYSFNPHDRVSYGPILKALTESHDRKLIIVSPTAGDVAKKLRGEYPHLRIEPITKTMKVWAVDSFRL